MTSDLEGWEKALKVMERRLAEGERNLAGAQIRLSHYALPAGLGPLPLELAARARAVRDATLDLETRFETALAAKRSRLQELRRIGVALREHGSSSRPQPVYVDRAV